MMNNKRNQYIFLAIVIGVLVLLPWFFNSPQTQEDMDNQSLFTSNFKMPDASVSRGGDAENLWEKGNVYYANQEYGKAIESFEGILEDSTFNRTSQVRVLLGACLMAEGDMEKSIEILGSVNETSFEIERATWYRGLAFLQLEDVDAAKDHFVKLAQNDKGEYYQPAQKLLTQLQ